MISAMISARGMSGKKGFALTGLSPSGRPASSSTRLSTPTVSARPQTGHLPPNSFVWCGSRTTPQSRCPSRWYLPSSGKNSTVPSRPSPVAMARRMAK